MHWWNLRRRPRLAVRREQVDLSDVPDVARGSALIFLIAGFLSMAFMGFAGLLSA